MAKQAKPKRAALKPTTAWAVVNQAGEIVEWLRRLEVYPVEGNASQGCYGGNRVEKVLTTKA